MTIADWCYTILIAAGMLADHFVIWPAFIRRSRVDQPSARLWLWLTWMSLLWALVAVGIVLWLLNAREWPALGMAVPQGWRLWGSALLVAAFSLYQIQVAARIARIPGPKPKLRAQFGAMSIMLPHSLGELRRFTAMSVTAGFCEEFLFRGYLIWALAPLLGWWGAAILSLAVFTAAHAYQGKTGALQAAFLGGIITLLVALSGSLLPAIALHMIIDASAGVIAWLVLRQAPVSPVPADAAESQ